jgi:hypothetical protein
MPWYRLLTLALVLATLSACVVQPYGRGRGEWSGGYHNDGHDYGPRDYGRRTWRER